MKRTSFSLAAVLYLLCVSFAANSYVLLAAEPRILCGLVPCFLFVNVLGGMLCLRTRSRRLRLCAHGGMLLAVFYGSTILSVLWHILLAIHTIPGRYPTFLWSALLCIGVEALVFWNGILCVYCTSVQLGIRQRVVGAVCGMIPVANLIALTGILRTVLRELRFETEKEALNAARHEQQICATRYPLLLVHGVFFRDSAHLNYWGRIPKELEQNGARIYYGKHQSAASIADSAAELSARIREIVRETGCKKVNIIAHSKSGLDCRYAISKLDAAPMVASLTTINTPHRGCLFADHLLSRVSDKLKHRVASVYNTTLRRLGDADPDFLAAVNDLTAARCTALDEELVAPEGVYCQSVGSALRRGGGGKFPLNFSYHYVKRFDGTNDGLVSAKSFHWGENYSFLRPPHDQGISHGDMIDLNRENIDGFDVREFYVSLVSELKDRGL